MNQQQQHPLPPVIPVRIEVLSATLRYLVAKPYSEVSPIVRALEGEVNAATVPIAPEAAQAQPLPEAAVPELAPAEVVEV